MNLSVCAIIKDEAPYLMEWLEYHFIKGVEHFFIYDNESVDGSTEILRTYARDGLITLIPWPGKSSPQNSRQLAAYRHCVKTFGQFTKWLACIDADEFICTKGRSSVSDLLNTEYAIYSALAPHWVLFGNSGHEKKPNGLVVEAYTKSAATADKHVKTILRPRYFEATGNDVHHFLMTGRVVDEGKHLLPKHYPFGDPHSKPTASKIWINHYITKSTEEARKRFGRKRVDTGEARNFNTHFPAHNRNERTNLTASIYGPSIKHAIEKRHATWRNQ